MEKTVKITFEFSDKKPVLMRRPKMKDMDLVEEVKDDLKRERALIGNLTELTPDEIADLDIYDYKLLQKELVGFQSPPKKEE